MTTKFIEAEISGQWFRLILALDPKTKHRGFANQATIPAHIGMLFVFPIASRVEFVMRECLCPIDIVFLDSESCVLDYFQAQPEEPQRCGETPIDYEARLHRYASPGEETYVLELKGGTVEALGLTRQMRMNLGLKIEPE